MIEFKVGDTFKAYMFVGQLAVEGKIQVEDGRVFLCQDTWRGTSCKDKLGYKHSWDVGTIKQFSIFNLKRRLIYEFEIISSIRKSRIEKLKHSVLDFL